MIHIFQRLQQEFHRRRMEVSTMFNRGAHVTDHRITLEECPPPTPRVEEMYQSGFISIKSAGRTLTFDPPLEFYRGKATDSWGRVRYFVACPDLGIRLYHPSCEHVEFDFSRLIWYLWDTCACAQEVACLSPVQVAIRDFLLSLGTESTKEALG